MSLRRAALAALALMAVIVTVAGCGSESERAPAIPEDEIAARADQQPADEPPAGEEAPEIEEPAEEAAGEDLTAGEPGPMERADEGPGFWARMGGWLKVAGIVLGKLLFVLVLPVAIAGTLVGLPGGVLVLADVVVYSAFQGWQVPPWWVLLVLALIAAVAELAENALSYLGVKQSGGTNATGVWTLVGGLLGAVLGGGIAPILGTIGLLGGPVGSVILAIVPPIGLGMVGGFLGGYLFELYRGREPEEARRAGWAALFGRLAGSFTKAMLVAVMAAIVLISTWGTLF
ncbi:MAG: DUF456 domain-containing protein [Armatimonadota bacterium]|nr:DUF456 domain-containing protein [Armatimonadota bacterium]